MPQQRFEDEVSVARTESSGSSDGCYTYIWLFPVRLMFLKMLLTLSIHPANTSAQQLLPLHSPSHTRLSPGLPRNQEDGEFDSFWFREIARQSDETFGPLRLWDCWDMSLQLWYWGSLRGEKRQNRTLSAFPGHFQRSTGRKLVSLKIQSVAKVEMVGSAYHVSLESISGKAQAWVIYQLPWSAQGCCWLNPWPCNAKLVLHYLAMSATSLYFWTTVICYHHCEMQAERGDCDRILTNHVDGKKMSKVLPTYVVLGTVYQGHCYYTGSSVHRLVTLLSTASTIAHCLPWTHSIALLWGLVRTANSRVLLQLLPSQSANTASDFDSCQSVSSTVQHHC